MLVQLATVLKKLQATVDETTRIIKTLTIDLDKIAHQGNDLTQKFNDLMVDINAKMTKLNPFFQSIENVGGNLEKATNKVKDQPSTNHRSFKFSPTLAGKLAKTAWKIYRKK